LLRPSGVWPGPGARPGGGSPFGAAVRPGPDDLLAGDPPFAPTILGLYRGAPLGARAGGAGAGAGDIDEPRSIVLYRKNLSRATTSRAELEKQVRITLWHEIGHLRGADEDDLRARGLE